MTTTASAHNVTAALRQSLESDIAALRALQQRLEDTGISEAEQFRVLWADCGMVVGETEDGTKLRLVDASDGLRGAFKAHQYEAQATADAWNSRLTHEQSVARCAVQVLTLTAAATRGIEDREALLDTLAKV